MQILAMLDSLWPSKRVKGSPTHHCSQFYQVSSSHAIATFVPWSLCNSTISQILVLHLCYSYQILVDQVILLEQEYCPWCCSRYEMVRQNAEVNWGPTKTFASWVCYPFVHLWNLLDYSDSSPQATSCYSLLSGRQSASSLLASIAFWVWPLNCSTDLLRAENFPQN